MTSEEVDSTASEEAKTDKNSPDCSSTRIKTRAIYSGSRRINKFHLMNFCRLQPSVFSCAVDCFLELSHAIFYPHFSDISTRSTFIETYMFSLTYELHVQENDEISIAEEVLAQVREPVWSQLTSFCPSFLARDSDAQFSEIFSSSLFNNLLAVEKALFYTEFSLKTSCSFCNKELTSNCEVLVHFLQDHDVTALENMHDWPKMLSPLWDNGSLHCTECDKATSCGVLVGSCSPSTVLFVEFDNVTRTLLTFYPQITVCDTTYVLKGLVRHQGRHFTCALLSQVTQLWQCIDDLCKNILEYVSYKKMMESVGNSPFFGMYICEVF